MLRFARMMYGRMPFGGMMAAFVFFFAAAAPVSAQVTAFMQAVAEAAAKDDAISNFYKARNYKPIWTGSGDRARRSAFLAALAKAPEHGLPMSRYDPAEIKAAFASAKGGRARGLVEVATTKAFLQYARDVQTGILTPSRVDSGIVRAVPLRDRLATLTAFAKSSPAGFLKKLPPQDPEYARLMKEKLALERLVGGAGWGAKVAAKSLKPGASGGAVVQLRNRLIRMGFLKRSAAQTYDANLQKAVQQFQLSHGLNPDGVAGAETVKEINHEPVERLQQILVAMERRRWINQPLGKRHLLVNLVDFHVAVIDNGKVTHKTRVVVGKNTSDRRTPEFSDMMTHMVINPTWNVPRSIATKEYLPMMKRNPNAAGHLKLVDSRGRTVSRGSVNFSQYSAKNFPFDMKQPPSKGNALGLVKFMFPNQYNIYLHDTPSKNLFSKEVRAYSHGCVRVQNPFDFAYALLKKQVADPEPYFQKILATKRETKVDLKEPVPVHLVYRTAFIPPKGPVQYRRDFYGRDARIFQALTKAGVVLRAVRG